ncbi:YcaO-like family protein [Rhizobium sp. BK650]|uniref:YcaO-like family protein n=1 Tax=Rhizobium sp. BK650 TaxID=2586990 RepID=UPI00161B2381|nr:YcaO-like family protein [Rhizobium sp. BK650]
MTSVARLTSYSDRSCSPYETLARITPSLSRYGITRLARLTDLDRIGIPVWNAITPNSRSIVINQGKGIDDIDARVSAAMEALERAVGGNPQIDVRLTSIRQLESEGCFAEPLDCLILAGQDDLRPEEMLRWVQGYDIIADRHVWVPYEAVLLDDTKSNRFWQSSDGLASGNIRIEATFHGLLERIERDAEVLWQFASAAEKSRNCINIHSFRDPVLSGLAQLVCDAGFRLQMFNRTTDIGVPCFEAFIAPDAPSAGDLRYIEVTYGAGAHPNPGRAAIRAVTEAAQSRLTFISGARDDIHPETFSRPLPAHLREVLFIEPTHEAHALDTTLGGTIQDMLRSVIGRLVAVGVTSAIAVEMNAGEEDFSVVKMLIPQLENLDGRRKRRFGPRALKRILRSR